MVNGKTGGVITQLNLTQAGDRVLAVETDRGILLTPYDPDVEAGLAVAAHAAKKFRNALRELAK